MARKALSEEQRRADADLWIILSVTLLSFLCFTIWGKGLFSYIKNTDTPLIQRLSVNVGLQFGVAGLGITVVCILRRECFLNFGLRKKNLMPSIVGTVLCFLPIIVFMIASGRFQGYRPFGTILVMNEVLAAGLPFAIFGVLLIALVWVFFEGFNYVVIGEIINRRYPSSNFWLDYGAVACAIVCLLFHSTDFSVQGIIEMLAMAIAIYGMLLVKKKTGNAWGAVFAFVFLWNAM